MHELGLQILDVFFLELEGLNILENFFDSCKYGKFPFERVLAEESFKNSTFLMSLVLPVSIAHGQLIVIS
jgi:hypothetical protein